MAEPIATERPTRLPVWGQWLVALLLLTSLASGIAIWWGQTIQDAQARSPDWLRGVLVVHGCLYPVQCVLFGILLCHHIRVGWQIRVNLVAGFILEAVFAGLILSGAGLYYAPESWRETIVWTHRILGISMPVALGFHWLAAHLWIRRLPAD